VSFEQNQLNQPVTVTSGGSAAGAPGAAGGPAAGLPCLNTNNCNEQLKDQFQSLSSAHRKVAFALIQNVILLVGRYGIERMGFLTLTFARHVMNYKEAQKALHSLMTGVLKKRYPEYIIVMERMDSQRIHYHLLVVLAQDVRTGFDFAAVKRGDYRSANTYLRREWQFWRGTAPKYGFGRTELMPVESTAKGIAKYLGKYIAKHIGQRLPEDKGARLVRYSKGTNRVGVQFSWASPGGHLWRSKLGMLCRMLGLNPDNYKKFLREWFGKNWVHHLLPLIAAIKLPEFHSPEVSRESLAAVWLVVNRERERCASRLSRAQAPAPIETAGNSPTSAQPQRTWATWIERTLKESEA
jgi:hypothetical protein